MELKDDNLSNDIDPVINSRIEWLDWAYLNECSSAVDPLCSK